MLASLFCRSDGGVQAFPGGLNSSTQLGLGFIFASATFQARKLDFVAK
jgi:hypothetical protein